MGVAAQRGQDCATALPIVQPFFYGRSQDGARANFQEKGVIPLGQGAQGVGKENGLVQMTQPIITVELTAVGQGAGHG